MIVDFPLLKSKLDKIAFSHLNFVLKREQSLISQFQRHILHEGQAHISYQTVDNEPFEESLKLISSAFDIPLADIANLKIHDVLQHFEKTAVELAKEEKKLTFQRMTEAVERVGNVMSAANKSFAESSLEVLEKIQIDFDDVRNKPALPTIIVHPTTAEKLRNEQKSMSFADKLSYEQKQEEILNRKYEEYVLRESNRKLVD